MKLNYKFSSLYGFVYKKGRVVFMPDGNTLLSPVGNRITAFDLVNHTSFTFPLETRKDIEHLAVTPDGVLLLAIDEDGCALLVNCIRRVVLAQFNLKERVKAIAFSPDGRHFAVTYSRHVKVWRVPGRHKKEFAAFVLESRYMHHRETVTCLDWSDGGDQLASGSKDLTVSICKVFEGREGTGKNKTWAILSGHRDRLVGVFFAKGDRLVYSVARDGALYIWKCEEVRSDEGDPNSAKNDADRIESNRDHSSDEEDHINTELNEDHSSSEEDQAERIEPNKTRWRLWKKLFFWDQAVSRVSMVELHRPSHLLVVGFEIGVFGLYDLTNLALAAQNGESIDEEDSAKLVCLQKISLSRNRIDSVSINATGEWLAFGVSAFGQLLVWEWQSEQYILKQQGHHHEMSSLSYSTDGQYIVTGGIDGKIKVWNTSTGLSFVTFKDHESSVTDVVFSPKGQVVLSSSLDGTIRAFDMIRYRNFRTMTSPTPTQFSCVDIDMSGEIVAAGTQTDFSVYIWSLQTGNLLDILKGHEGPLVDLSFSPTGSDQLITASWDKTAKIWHIYSSKLPIESLNHSSDLTALAYRPDGNEVCVATLDGCLTFWDSLDGTLKTVIDGHHDINAGRSHMDFQSYQNISRSKYYTCIAYTADGTCLLAGGNSRFVCLYHISKKILLKKFQISHNRSIDGLYDYLDSREIHMDDPPLSDDDQSYPPSKEVLPGVQTGDYSSRQINPLISTSDLAFSPNNRQWACATTSGLLVYILDNFLNFDPYMLDIHITPNSVLHTLRTHNYLKAIIMALRLNEYAVTRRVLLNTPFRHVHSVLHELHPNYLQRLLDFLALHMEDSPHVELHMRWISIALSLHGPYIQQNLPKMITTLRHLQKNILKQQLSIQDICDENQHLLSYIHSIRSCKHIQKPTQVDDDPLLESAAQLHLLNKEKEKLNDFTLDVTHERNSSPGLRRRKANAKG